MSDDVVYVVPMPAVPPKGPWYRRPLFAALVGLVVGAGAVGAAWAVSGSGAVASGSVASGAFALRGSLDLAGDHIPVPPENKDCEGNGGFGDIVAGAAVTVYDAAGKVVASGVLGAGKYADPVAFSGDCLFSFAVPGVPKGAKFYQVEVTHRGKLTASVDQAESGSFTATLGN